MDKHYCHLCKRYFHPLGIARHRVMHRDKRESVTISTPAGETITWFYNKDTKKKSPGGEPGA